MKSFRQLPEADVAGVVDILMRVSEMACEIPEIDELVINPMLSEW